MDDLGDLVTRAAHEAPDRVAVVEEDGRALTWAALDDEVSRIATGLGAAGVVGGHRVLLALGNRLELVTAYLGVLRAQAVAVPVNPRSTAERAGPDGRRLGRPDGARRRGLDRRRCARAWRRSTRPWPGSRERWPSWTPTSSTRAAPRTEVVVLDGVPDRGRAGVRRPARRRAAAGAAAAGPREAGGAALHQRRDRPAARGDAHPPGAAGQHRPGGAGRAADDPRRRRHLGRAAALPRLRAQRGARRRRAARRDARAAAALRPGRHPRPGRRPRVHDAAGRAGGLPALAGAAGPARAARRRTPRAVRVGSAAREVVEEFEAATGLAGAPGLRADRGRARRDQHAAAAPRAKPGSVGGPRRPSTACELRLVDEPGAVLGGEDPGEIELRGPNLFQRLLARRRRTAPVPKAGGPRATWASSTRTATCSSSTASRSSCWSRASTSIPTRSRT